MRLSDIGRPTEQTVSCLIYAKSSQKILLLKRSDLEDSPGCWCMPGGHVEAEETYLQAAVRECREETGIDLEGQEYQLIYKTKTDWPLITNWVYAFKIDDELETILNWESESAAWFQLDQLPQPLHWTINALLSSDSAGERFNKTVAK